MNALQKLGDATRMLSEVRNAQDAKKLKDLAGAAKYYSQKAKLGKEAIDYAHSIQIEAESLLGGFLKTADKNVGVVGSVVTGTKRVPVKDKTVTLAEIGISKKESSAAQLFSP